MLSASTPQCKSFSLRDLKIRNLSVNSKISCIFSDINRLTLDTEKKLKSEQRRRCWTLAQSIDFLFEPINPKTPDNPDLELINEDSSPTLQNGRILSVWDIASLWIGLVVGKVTLYRSHHTTSVSL